MVRPPLVGQASSSSNESRQSLSSETEDVHEDINISQFSRSTSERFPLPTLNIGDYYVDLPNRHSPHYLSNREDYISAKPPEGSSDHSLVSLNTAEPSSDGGPRISSPTSSVTSLRPLEWDSGADVGYQQNYLESVQRLDPVFSTIERLAIAQGTASLLTRSDPEGTTEPSAQPVAKTIIKLKKNTKENDSIGLPKAQSTPFGTFMPNENPMGICDICSPITLLNSQMSILVHQGATSTNLSNTLANKYSLFPELNNFKQVSTYDLKFKENLSKHKDDRKKFQESPEVEIKSSTSKNSSLITSASNSHSVYSPDKTSNSPQKSVSHSTSPDLIDKDLASFKNVGNDECNFGNYNKKISSSLEDIRDVDNLVIGSLTQSNTLPRCQSQNNIHSDKGDKLGSNNEIKHQSTNMVIHGFPITTNKSASSSSVATVVQKKNDSPLHFPKLVQTSFLKQSVGIQACEQQNQIFDLKPISKSLISYETRSNYFIQKLHNTDHNQSDNSKIENIELHLEHCHKGIACRGAHKKLGVDKSYEMIGRVTNTSDNKHNLNSPVFELPENIRYQESTLDSIESSSKSRGFSTDRPGSMAAEDRVNSFEYLPGYVYETGKQLSSHSTSSISAAHKNSSGNVENLWDTDDSINLTRDINRGVEIIKDVVRNKNTSDNEMKKKVIQLVVEKLINTNYEEDDFKSLNINGNVPWVPPILENRNDTKLRRQEKSKVPGELSSLTDTSRDTSNKSSECFKPKPPGIPRDIDTTKLHLIDKCIGTGDSITSSSERGHTTSQTNISVDSTDATKRQTPLHSKIMSNNMEKENQEYSMGSTSTSSLKYDKRNWREPVTKAEQLYEQRRMLQKEKVKHNIENKRVIQFLDLEKKTQLLRIDIEMEHLNNLRKLLNKTEELKENMKDLKKNRSAIKKSQEESDTIHTSKFEMYPPTSAYHRKTPSSPLKRKLASRQYKPNLLSWLNKAKTSSETTRSSVPVTKPSSSSQEIKNDWSSHHYLSEDPESCSISIKSRQELNRKSFSCELKNRKDDERRNTSNSSALKTATSKEKHSLQSRSSIKYNKRTDLGLISEDSLLVNANILRRKNEHSDLNHSVGVQTTKTSEQNLSDKLNKINNCECHNVCGCCKENRWCTNEKDIKQPVGYYITFQSVPKSDHTVSEKPSLEEVRIPVPVSKYKTSESNQNGVKKIIDRRKKESCSTTESDVEDNDQRQTDIQHHKPTLQDYLVINRPDYVHRANDRRQCIAQLAYLRELRDQSKRRLLALSQPLLPRELPPPPLAVKRVFSQKRMRQQTEKKYKQLAEVQSKQQDTKRKEAYRTNRLMAEVFTKKLQRRVLKGDINLSNSVSIISNL